MEKISIKSILTPIGTINIFILYSSIIFIQLKTDSEIYIKKYLDKWIGDYYIDEADNENKVLNQAYKQLDEYFNNKRTVFELDIKPFGTEFQKRVWDSVYKIKYGQTASYKEITLNAGYLNAYRAAGAAIGANPIPIIIPCHRIIGSDGSLTGFRGGLDTKRKLLKLEGLL